LYLIRINLRHIEYLDTGTGNERQAHVYCLRVNIVDIVISAGDGSVATVTVCLIRARKDFRV
jgi:hypothetical protein